MYYVYADFNGGDTANEGDVVPKFIDLTIIKKNIVMLLLLGLSEIKRMVKI